MICLNFFSVKNSVNPTTNDAEGTNFLKALSELKLKVKSKAREIIQFLKDKKINENVYITYCSSGMKSVTFTIFNLNKNIIKTVDCFQQEREKLKEIIEFMLKKHKLIKLNLVSTNTFIETVTQQKRECFIHGGFQIQINQIENVNALLLHLKSNLEKNEGNFQESSSCLSMYKVKYFELDIHAYQPTFYGNDTFKVPKNLINSHSLMNINNDSKNENRKDFCFISCVLAARHWYKFSCDKMQRNLKSYEKYIHTLNIDSMNFPVNDIDINLFCRNNRQYSVDIYEYHKSFNFKKANISIVRKTQKRKKYHVDLLKLSETEGDEEKCHFLLIKDFDRFCTKYYSENKDLKVFCKTCGFPFSIADSELMLCTKDEIRKKLIVEKNERRKEKKRIYREHNKRKKYVSSDSDCEDDELTNNGRKEVSETEINKLFVCKECQTPYDTDMYTIIHCRDCLTPVSDEMSLKRHSEFCVGKPFKLVDNDNKFLKFKNHQNTIPSLITAFADLECFLKPINDQKDLLKVKGGGNILQQHMPFMSGVKYDILKCSMASSDEHLKPERIFYGKESALDLLKCLIDDAVYFYLNYLKYDDEDVVIMTDEDEIRFKVSSYCEYCNCKFSENNRKCRDHARCMKSDERHLRAVLCNNCNLKLKVNRHVMPIYFHNGTNYDISLLYPLFAEIYESEPNKKHDFRVLAKNKNKFIKLSYFFRLPSDEFNVDADESVEKNLKYFELRFLDSCNFVPESLNSIAKQLDDDDFVLLKEKFNNQLEFNNLRKKQILMYDYLNEETLLETQFPDKDSFFNTLTQSEICEDDYNFGINQFNYYKAKFELENPDKKYTLFEYTKLYLIVDVYILADFVNSLRGFFMKHYNLEVNHYVTASAITMDCFLKYTEASIELFGKSEEDIFLFVLSSLRGGMSSVLKTKYSKGNFEEMNNCKTTSESNETYKYNSDKDKRFIYYLDFNALYTSAMMKAMPIGNYHFIDNTNDELMKAHFEVAKIVNDDSAVGYFVQCDISYPLDNLEEIEKFNNFPFLCELKRSCVDRDNKNKKLIADLLPKRLVIHHSLLQSCINHGLNVFEPTKILKFDQCQFIKPYMQKNADIRKEEADRKPFWAHLAKLLCNALYGKILQLGKHYRRYELVSSWSRYGDEDEEIQLFHDKKNDDEGENVQLVEESSTYKKKKIRFRKKCGSVLVAKPNFIRQHNVRKNLNLFELGNYPLEVKFPIAVGCSVLDIAKSHMSNFWYMYIEEQKNVLKKSDPTLTINSIYTDTDSIVFEMVSKTGIKLEDMQSNDKKEAAKWFDLSTYSNEDLKRLGFEEKHIFRKVPGRMKNEVPNGSIIEFAALQSKCYSYVVMLNDGTLKTHSRHKGIKSYIIKQLQFPNYRRKIGKEIDLSNFKINSTDDNFILHGDIVDKDGYIEQYSISTRDKRANCPSLDENNPQADLNQTTICTVKQKKKVLNPLETKRFEIPNSIETLAFGHPRILNYSPDIDYKIMDINENRYIHEECDNPIFDEFELY